jgi:acid phosphatase family membrane protein YuiD
MILLFDEIWRSRILLSCALAWAQAQAVKTIVLAARHERLSLRSAITSLGGMPSSHAAFVTALFSSVYIAEGISTSFVIALAFGLVTLRDAVGIRLAASNQAKILNEMLATARSNYRPLPESLGHKPAEVFAGIVTGIITVALVNRLV